MIDNLLLYVTGGIAAGHFKTTYTSQFLGIPGVIAGFTNSAESREWRWGMVAGFGAEWAWTDRVSIRSEVLYVDFVDRENRYLFAPPAGFANFTRERLDVGQPHRPQREVRRLPGCREVLIDAIPNDQGSGPRQPCRGPFLLSPLAQRRDFHALRSARFTQHPSRSQVSVALRLQPIPSS